MKPQSSTYQSPWDQNHTRLTARSGQPSATMQRIISSLAAKHHIDLSQPDAYLRLEQPGFDPLIIESIGHNLVSVAHYYEQNGDLMANPDIVFFIAGGRWIPFEITQHAINSYRRYGEIDATGHLSILDAPAQVDLAAFSNTWAANLQTQGWLGLKPTTDTEMLPRD